ncbi:hypothetical protein BC835DRAFT_1305652 [Cytidiella melzeri]|nr:hypothetical protein BC835DRAFT_1305652 [Cytidiella melzeri]
MYSEAICLRWQSGTSESEFIAQTPERLHAYEVMAVFLTLCDEAEIVSFVHARFSELSAAGRAGETSGTKKIDLVSGSATSQWSTIKVIQEHARCATIQECGLMPSFARAKGWDSATSLWIRRKRRAVQAPFGHVSDLGPRERRLQKNGIVVRPVAVPPNVGTTRRQTDVFRRSGSIVRDDDAEFLQAISVKIVLKRTSWYSGTGGSSWLDRVSHPAQQTRAYRQFEAAHLAVPAHAVCAKPVQEYIFGNSGSLAADRCALLVEYLRLNRLRQFFIPTRSSPASSSIRVLSSQHILAMNSTALLPYDIISRYRHLQNAARVSYKG